MRAHKDQTSNTSLGVLLVGAGLFLFLALWSYHPEDLPSWVFFAHISPPSEVPHNWIGRTGAIVAGLFYFLFGAAAYLVPVGAIGFGSALLWGARLPLIERSLWFVVLVLSGAGLLEIQPWFLTSWKEAFHLEGPGGWFGYWLGRRALMPAFSGVGSTLVLLTIYLVSLIIVTGIHPVTLIREGIHRLKCWIRARSEARKLKLSDEEKLAAEQKRLEKEAARLEKKVQRKKGRRKSGDASASEDSGVQPTAEDAQKFPEPKIVDASVPAAPKKPSLAELEARRTAQKKPGGGLTDIQVENYELPPLDLLDPHDEEVKPADPAELERIRDTIIETLQQFGIEVAPGDITKGPTITRFEVYPARGVRVDRISNLERDIARATRAERINILAPIPGKDTVGIESANKSKGKVTLRELMASQAWEESNAKLPLALGKDVYGNVILADLALMPHCLVAGTTGSGKSVCINSIIASLLFRYTPEELRFIMIDPKVVEMQVYNALPHLVTPVVTDPKKVLLALRWVIEEMEQRYRAFAKVGVRNVNGFNSRPKPKSQQELDAEAAAQAGEDAAVDETPPPESNGDAPDALVADEEEPPPPVQVPRDDEIEIPDQMPYIVVIVDELADLMQTAPADVESSIARITQMARAAGIHMIVATQTPRADVVTGIIKANIPSRVAFQVASKIDSRVILDENGAERLLGQGDMLYLPPGTSRLTRAQGVLVTDDEIARLVDFVSKQADPSFEPSIHEKLTSNTPPEEEISDEDEELVEKCLDIIKQEKRASTSMLQRRLRLGYTRAARVVDILEQRGILAPRDGSKDREILVDLDSMP